LLKSSLAFLSLKSKRRIELKEGFLAFLNRKLELEGFLKGDVKGWSILEDILKR
jgi:hypothetical protein